MSTTTTVLLILILPVGSGPYLKRCSSMLHTCILFLLLLKKFLANNGVCTYGILVIPYTKNLRFCTLQDSTKQGLSQARHELQYVKQQLLLTFSIQTMFWKAAAFLSSMYLFQGDNHGLCFKEGLNAEEKRRRDRRMPRCSIKPYADSLFQHIYECGDDQALFNIRGCTHKVFWGLLQQFEPLYHVYQPNMLTSIVERQKYGSNESKLGRPRQLDATGCLGLVLLWYRTCSAMSQGLATIFGLTNSVMNVWLKFGRRLLIHALQGNPYATVSTPTAEDLKLYQAAISAKYPVLAEQNVWGAADGLKLLIKAAGNNQAQNHFIMGGCMATM